MMESVGTTVFKQILKTLVVSIHQKYFVAIIQNIPNRCPQTFSLKEKRLRPSIWNVFHDDYNTNR